LAKSILVTLVDFEELDSEVALKVSAGERQPRSLRPRFRRWKGSETTAAPISSVTLRQDRLVNRLTLSHRGILQTTADRTCADPGLGAPSPELTAKSRPTSAGVATRKF
jgi:hypothetical protein